MMLFHNPRHLRLSKDAPYTRSVDCGLVRLLEENSFQGVAFDTAFFFRRAALQFLERAAGEDVASVEHGDAVRDGFCHGQAVRRQ